MNPSTLPPPIRKPDPPPGRRPFPPPGQQRVRRSVTLNERQLDILHVALSEAACSNIVVSGKLVTHDEYRGISRALALLTPEAA